MRTRCHVTVFCQVTCVCMFMCVSVCLSACVCAWSFRESRTCVREWRSFGWEEERWDSATPLNLCSNACTVEPQKSKCLVLLSGCYNRATRPENQTLRYIYIFPRTCTLLSIVTSVLSGILASSMQPAGSRNRSAEQAWKTGIIMAEQLPHHNCLKIYNRSHSPSPSLWEAQSSGKHIIIYFLLSLKV